MAVEMVQLETQLVLAVDQAEAEELADLIQEKELTQIAEVLVIHLQQVPLKVLEVVIHLQLLIKLLVAVEDLVLLELMVHKQDLAESVEPVELELIFHQVLILVLEYVE
tara:strand:- start:66 stop:392 length:327 start_codon:yes stop_codon:yes gene_type:complete